MSSSSSGNSRLDRLFLLLSSSSTPSARTMAAKQLGAVVRAHQEQLLQLLERLHPLLHSSQWDAR